jgi:hypothetical protein
MIHGTVVKDSQNPYRTGVLVGNHVEDRFGQDLAAREVSFETRDEAHIHEYRNNGRRPFPSKTLNTTLEIQFWPTISSPRQPRTYWYACHP